MIKCLLSRPGLIAGPLHSTPLQIKTQSIPRLDPSDSKSSLTLLLASFLSHLVERIEYRSLGLVGDVGHGLGQDDGARAEEQCQHAWGQGAQV